MSTYQDWLNAFADILEEFPESTSGDCYMCFVVDDHHTYPEFKVVHKLRSFETDNDIGYEESCAYRTMLTDAIKTVEKRGDLDIGEMFLDVLRLSGRFDHVQDSNFKRAAWLRDGADPEVLVL